MRFFRNIWDFSVHVACVFIISNLPFSTSIRMEDCARKRYVDTFIITYRQLYFVQKTFILWACIQMILIFLFALFYNPFMIFFWLFTASAMGFAPSKKVFRVLLCLLAVMLGAFVFVNMNQLTPTSLVNIVPMFILMLLRHLVCVILIRKRC